MREILYNKIIMCDKSTKHILKHLQEKLSKSNQNITIFKYT